MSWQQLQYAGVFEAVKIRKLGFPFRYTHEEFFKRFKIICQHKAWGKMSHLDGCKFLIQEMKQTFDKVCGDVCCYACV
jgi:myosin heavy subunit